MSSNSSNSGYPNPFNREPKSNSDIFSTPSDHIIGDENDES